MTFEEKVKITEQNIWTALDDYRAHTYATETLDDVSEAFVKNLARDSVKAKQPLRELFRHSPCWNEELDALIINGNRTHDPDYDYISREMVNVLRPVLDKGDEVITMQIRRALDWFVRPDMPDPLRENAAKEINLLAPHAYHPGRKPSRIFRDLCRALGIADETPGSEFQRRYAKIADELSGRRIDFKLFVSINPAHFLTMSNPKEDKRGSTLTSCHSFNSTEYSYNNGCSGYARDNVSFIVFTVDDSNDRETLNNRKTTRQIFAYRPGSGLLMQSRLYNTFGGTHGAQEESKVYRDLVQREICILEDVPNLWKTYSSTGDYDYLIQKGTGFGGYCDWRYAEFDGHISIRNGTDPETVDPLFVGEAGLCIKCGWELSEDDGLYCEDCTQSFTCDCCGERVHGESYEVRNANGEWEDVCEECLNQYYTYCDECNEYWPNDSITYVNGTDYCPDCLKEHCCQCEDCGDWMEPEDIYICYDAEGNPHQLCPVCLEDRGYVYCEDCGEYVQPCSDGSCPHCGVIMEDENRMEEAGC